MSVQRNSLPPVRVGQVWQCRGQDIHARIMTQHGEEYFYADYMVVPYGRKWRDRNVTLLHAVQIQDSYQCSTGAANCDLTNLLYDPPE